MHACLPLGSINNDKSIVPSIYHTMNIFQMLLTKKLLGNKLFFIIYENNASLVRTIADMMVAAPHIFISAPLKGIDFTQNLVQCLLLPYQCATHKEASSV